ncbi:MAG: hypothetical protein IIC35_09450, partial [Gemmatimonadetes bacterium]|nr:hypothetical protein [Gemmatimonadota bacterium]
MSRLAESRTAVWSALAASLGTLICCALPSLLVLLGFGTTVAAVVSAAPWLVVLSRNKIWVFLAAGLLILGSRAYSEYVSPRFTPRVGDPHPRRLNFVAGRTLTEQALNTEQRHRDRRFTLLGRVLAPGIIEGLEVRLNSGAAGSAEIRLSPGIGLTADGEDIALRRAMVARIADIPPARALIEERL